jgi:hypothetical protein
VACDYNNLIESQLCATRPAPAARPIRAAAVPPPELHGHERLGVTEGSYLDAFRETISEIGNALG